MQDPLAQFINQLDLRPIYYISSVVLMIEIIFMINLVMRGIIGAADGPILRISMAFSLMLMGLAIYWSFVYGDNNGWQPWPPHIAMMLCLNISFGIGVWSGARRAMHDDKIAKDFKQANARRGSVAKSQ